MPHSQMSPILTWFILALPVIGFMIAAIWFSKRRRNKVLLTVLIGALFMGELLILDFLSLFGEAFTHGTDEARRPLWITATVLLTVTFVLVGLHPMNTSDQHRKKQSRPRISPEEF
jgi:hypothetical protein